MKMILPCFQGETDFDTDTKSVKVRDRLRGNKAELSWLMRTSYISNETESRRQAAGPRAKPSEAVEQSLDADEAHLQAAEVMITTASCTKVSSIFACLMQYWSWTDRLCLYSKNPLSCHSEAFTFSGQLFQGQDGNSSEVNNTSVSLQASFEAAQQGPVHATNPNLRAVEITPGLSRTHWLLGTCFCLFSHALLIQPPLLHSLTIQSLAHDKEITSPSHCFQGLWPNILSPVMRGCSWVFSANPRLTKV